MEVYFKENNIDDIDKVLEASKKVFEPSPSEIKTYHDQEDWLNKINNHGLLVTALVNGNIVGFTICYQKEKNSLHIWNVGVLSEYRGLKIWSGMYDLVLKHATRERIVKLTINTYKTKFPNMYSFLTHRGFSCYKTELVGEVEKSFFEKRID